MLSPSLAHTVSELDPSIIAKLHVLYCIYYNLGNIMNHKNTLQFKDDVIISTKAKRIITQFLEDA